MVGITPFYVDRWLGGTRILTLDERGAFADWIAAYAARDGLFPDDINLLANLWGCTTRKAKRLRVSLIAKGKLYSEDGCLHQTFAKLVVNRAIAKSEQATNAAYKRWENYRKANGNTNATAGASAYASAEQSAYATPREERKKASSPGEIQQPPPVENPKATPPPPKPPHQATRADLEAAFAKHRGPFT